ncbi:hypothetical protein tb265_00990 [Gemmatimonadetes bacterium T265]|nr:hypothetical protein tb265_00990 [Gemmatimonadetes bacterium T265]
MPTTVDPFPLPLRVRSPLAAGVAAAAVAAALVAGPLGAGADAAQAQVVAVDEGSFVVTRAGAVVGREEFRIVRQPSAGGTAFVARAVGAYGARRVLPALQAGPDGGPVRYQVDVRGAGAEERVSGQGSASGHFAAQVQRGGREGAREYLLAPGTVVADDDAYHQLYFVARRAMAGATRVPVLVPRTDAQLTVVVTRAGAEPVTIAGRAIPATHFALADAGAGWRRDVWVDGEGRVLRVVVPGLGLDATREDPPR